MLSALGLIIATVRSPSGSSCRLAQAATAHNAAAKPQGAGARPAMVALTPSTPHATRSGVYVQGYTAPNANAPHASVATTPPTHIVENVATLPAWCSTSGTPCG